MQEPSTEFVPVMEPEHRVSYLALWRKSAPARVLQVYVVTHFLFSFSYMYYFCRHFGFSRRLAILHLSTVTGPTLMTLLVAGLCVSVTRHRSRRVARYLIAAVCAAWTAVLTLLYLVHFAGNSLWGNNVNYQIVSHYLLRRRIVEDDGLSLSASTYVVLAAAAFVILAIHLALSRKVLAALEPAFLPDRASSLFYSRRRTLVSGALIGVWLVLYGVYVHAVPGYLSADWSAELEPITSFFQLDLYDMRHTAIAERLRVDEPRARASYPAGQSFERKNVVVIIVDSLRADHMQAYGYRRPTTPFLNDLIQSGRLTRVEFATSTCAESNCGILSTLSSKTLPSLIPEDFKVHDLLHDQGYKTYFILSGDHEWFGLKKSYGKDLTQYADNTTSQGYRGIADDRAIFEGLGQVPVFDGTPAFFYFHLMSVHIAGVKHPEYRVYQPADVGRDWDELVHGRYDVTALVNSYDNGVVEADATIRQVFEALNRKRYLENSLVVILADHGEGLGERGARDFGHIKWLYQEFIRIPFLVYDDSKRFPGKLPYATQIDVAPTIVDRLGLTIPSSWQGRSLLEPDTRQYTFHQTSLMNPSFSVLFRPEGRLFQYLYRPQNRQEELYELLSDPSEARNLMASADRSLIADLRSRLEQYRSQH
jgi:glucan phosphoethanolaminetransferase (alkaline phosphatase superfamily)